MTSHNLEINNFVFDVITIKLSIDKFKFYFSIDTPYFHYNKLYSEKYKLHFPIDTNDHDIGRARSLVFIVLNSEIDLFVQY